MIVVSSATSYFVIQRAEQARRQTELRQEAAKHPEQAQTILAQAGASKRRNLRIIPIILGIFGYTYGSLLGVFFVGMLTATRGNDFGNVLAMVMGFVAVAILSGLPNDLAGMFGGQLYAQPGWLPVIEFPWRVMFGTIVTFLVAVSFPSRQAALAPARTGVTGRRRKIAGKVVEPPASAAKSVFPSCVCDVRGRGAIAQLVRAPPCHGGGCGFEPRWLRFPPQRKNCCFTVSVFDCMAPAWQ